VIRQRLTGGGNQFGEAMPSIVAALFCTGCVVLLLWQERKQSHEVSQAVWLPTVWVMACICKPLAMWYGSAGSGSVEDGSPLDRSFASLLIALGMLVIAKRRISWAIIRKNNAWLVALCVYAFVSILWSDFPFVSIKRYVRFTGSIIMALVLLSDPAPLCALESLLRRIAFVLIPFSMLLVKYYPDVGCVYGKLYGNVMWVGVTTQKNNLGVLCFISIFFLVWSLLRAWDREKGEFAGWKTAPHVAILLASMHLLRGPSTAAASKTAFIALSVGCLCLLGLLWMKNHGRCVRRSMLLAAVVVAFVYGVGLPFGMTSLFSGVLESLGRDTTFTGRNEIWEELIPVAMGAPVLGLGYGGYWVRPIESDVNEAHNGYLDVVLELGVVGLALLFGFVVSLCRKAHACLVDEFWWGSFGFAFLLATVLHNASESTFLKTSDSLWTLLIFVSMLLPRRSLEKDSVLDKKGILQNGRDVSGLPAGVVASETHVGQLSARSGQMRRGHSTGAGNY
jgi:O-antigen ligase